LLVIHTQLLGTMVKMQLAQFIGATHRRKTHIKKEEEQC
jgi:hypothetical protein